MITARLVSVQIAFEIMADDGLHLRHVNIDPVIVDADNIDAIPQGIRASVEQVQAQLDAQNATPENRGQAAPGD